MTCRVVRRFVCLVLINLTSIIVVSDYIIHERGLYFSACSVAWTESMMWHFPPRARGSTRKTAPYIYIYFWSWPIQCTGLWRHLGVYSVGKFSAKCRVLWGGTHCSPPALPRLPWCCCRSSWSPLVSLRQAAHRDASLGQYCYVLIFFGGSRQYTYRRRVLV